jgi:hypothetical protein
MYMGCKMEFYGLCGKVVMTFKNTHGMFAQWNYMDHITRL